MRWRRSTSSCARLSTFATRSVGLRIEQQTQDRKLVDEFDRLDAQALGDGDRAQVRGERLVALTPLHQELGPDRFAELLESARGATPASRPSA